jgi:phosphoglycolate phosphatase
MGQAGQGMTARGIDGIVFDKDGTLFDFRRSWGRWTLRMLDTLAPDAPPERLAQVVGFHPELLDFTADSPIIACTPSEIAAIMLPDLPGWTLQRLEDHLNGLSATAEMAPVAPLRALMADLRGRGLRLGLATNDTERPARVHMAQHGITDMFDAIYGCDSGHGGKPEPGMLLAFAHATGLAPARIAMVGDSRHDLAAGRAAGMVTVGVLTGIAARADLADLADVILPDITHLPGWVDTP